MGSFSVSSAIMSFFEFTEISIKDPLIEFARYDGFSIETGTILWVSTWIIFNFSIIALIKLTHERLNLAKSFETKVLEWYIAVISALIIVRYLNSITIKSPIFSDFYSFIIPTINIAIGIFVILAFFRNTLDVSIKISFRYYPRG